MLVALCQLGQFGYSNLSLAAAAADFWLSMPLTVEDLGAREDPVIRLSYKH